jgi:hypothetical protein
MTHEEEARMLDPFLDEAKKGGILIVSPIKNAYEQAAGREVPDSTVYRMLALTRMEKAGAGQATPQNRPSRSRGI